MTIPNSATTTTLPSTVTNTPTDNAVPFVVIETTKNQDDHVVVQVIPIIPEQQPIILRTSLNGCWILDKTIGEWSMKSYLETMNVDPLAIIAYSKGENESNTIHDITMNDTNVMIIKRSRMNNTDLIMNVPLNHHEPIIEYLPPGQRPKKTKASSQHPCHLQIHSSLTTINGQATVIDTKTLITKQEQRQREQQLQHEQNQQEPSSSTSTNPVPTSTLQPPLDSTTNMMMTTTTTATTANAVADAAFPPNFCVLQQELTVTNEQTGKSYTTIRYFNPIPHMDYIPPLSSSQQQQVVPILSPTPPKSKQQDHKVNINNNHNNNILTTDSSMMIHDDVPMTEYIPSPTISSNVIQPQQPL